MKTFSQFISEAFLLDINIGDVILMGRFKNKKVVVKSIETVNGDLLINGKKAAKFRLQRSANDFHEDLKKELGQ